MEQNKAEKQKQKAKEMLGIGDDRAKELFNDDEETSHMDEKRKELEGEN
ncbi:MAG: hypothetical protein ABEJ36_03315 [Candidatus Nanosalina sp.]